jgi:hypothetical protein
MERCHARKSKIHSNIFEIEVQIVFTSLFVIRMVDCSRGAASAA